MPTLYEWRLTCRKIKLVGPNITKRPRLIWCPAHAGLDGNEKEDALAWDLTNLAECQPPAIESHLMAPQDILAYQRSTRQKYSAPHKSLGGEDATDLRKVQAGVFSYLSWHRKWYPTLYRDAFLWCDSSPTLYHMSWVCGKPDNLKSFLGNNIVTSSKQWEAQLASSDTKVHLALLCHVRWAAQASGALVLGPQPTCFWVPLFYPFLQNKILFIFFITSSTQFMCSDNCMISMPFLGEALIRCSVIQTIWSCRKENDAKLQRKWSIFLLIVLYAYAPPIYLSAFDVHKWQPDLSVY